MELNYAIIAGLVTVIIALIVYSQVLSLSGFKFLVEENYQEIQTIKDQIREVLVSKEIAREALRLAEDIKVEQEAIKRSTHTVIPVGNTQATEKLEEQFRKVMGMGGEDFDYDLQKNGFKSAKEDDLV